MTDKYFMTRQPFTGRNLDGSPDGRDLGLYEIKDRDSSETIMSFGLFGMVSTGYIVDFKELADHALKSLNDSYNQGVGNREDEGDLIISSLKKELNNARNRANHLEDLLDKIYHDIPILDNAHKRGCILRYAIDESNKNDR